jgi:hypothetical protein
MVGPNSGRHTMPDVMQRSFTYQHIEDLRSPRTPRGYGRRSHKYGPGRAPRSQTDEARNLLRMVWCGIQRRKPEANDPAW